MRIGLNLAGGRCGYYYRQTEFRILLVRHDKNREKSAMALDPKKEVYVLTNKSPWRIVRAAAVISIAALLLTLWVVYNSWNSPNIFVLYITIGAWAVVPPAWFWYDYFYVYRKYGEPDTLELFKYGQDVSKAIWAGVLAALIAFAASDVVKPKESDDCRNCPNQPLNPTAPKSSAPVSSGR